MQIFKYFLTFHETQPGNICKKLWDLWNNRKIFVEESIDYFDPRHKYWSQVLRYHIFVFYTRRVSIVLINPISFIYMCTLVYSLIYPIILYQYIYILLIFNIIYMYIYYNILLYFACLSLYSHSNFPTDHLYC